MKSKASSPKLKSLSREVLLKAAAEQYRVLLRRRTLESQDLVPAGYFTASELSLQLNINTNTVKRMLRRLGINPVVFKIFSGANLQKVEHFKLTK